MQFAYEAMQPDGSVVAAQIEANDSAEAADTLRDKGLMVLRLEQGREGKSRATLNWQRSAVSPRDLILFTRQMKMLLESGAAVVPALEAACMQTSKPVMRDVLTRLRDRVEEGESLAEALEAEKKYFDPVFRSMVAAGEATGSLPAIFARLADLAQQQQIVRKMVLGAVLYPAILSVMMVGVISILLFFVVPRFRTLFVSLGSPLPATTKMLFGISEWLTHGWPYVVGVVAIVVTALVLLLRHPVGKVWLDRFVLNAPLIGKLASRLIFARVLRVWAAMLRCHVPLLDCIHQSQEAVSSRVFLALLHDVEESVAGGQRVAQALESRRVADAVVVSAIRTGEENGRLAEAVDFVSTWLDDDNRHAVQSITRLAEPMLLAFMGLIVGTVAMSLFLPLFDLAMAG